VNDEVIPMRRALLCLALLAAVAPSRAAVAATSSSTPATRALEQLLSSSAPSSSKLSVQRIGGLPEQCLPTRATPLSPLDKSGPAVVDVEGEGCGARVVVDVRVQQPVLVVKQAAATGAPLSAVTAVEFREVQPWQHAVTALPDGAVARRALSPGRVLVDDDFALPGPDAGSPVKVVLSAGGLRVVRTATAMPCAGVVDPRHHCARLPNGRQVHGVFDGGVLQMKETP
jgi:flagella basal body P-ring formation protein FlgA